MDGLPDPDECNDDGEPVSKAIKEEAKSRHVSVREKMEQITSSVVLDAGEIVTHALCSASMCNISNM